MSLTDEVKRSAGIKSPIDLAEEVATLEAGVLEQLRALVWHGRAEASPEMLRCYHNGRVFLESGFAWMTRAIASRIADGDKGTSH